MQMKKAKALREAWGGKPCDHPDLEKEYHLGAQSEDYVCTTCGESFTKQEAQQIRDNHTAHLPK